jgi:sulfite exporter TauE/SafE
MDFGFCASRSPGMTSFCRSSRAAARRLFHARKEPPVQILAYLLARFSEPSSYAGLGAVLALAGWNLTDPALAQLVQLLAAACGLIALLLKDRGRL